MKRLSRIMSGLALVGLAGAVAYNGHEGWQWFLGAGVMFLGWGGRE